MNRRRPRGLLALVAALALALAAPGAGAQDPRQKADIHAVIQELDHLIDHVEALAARHRDDPASVRFNYPALLEQLRLTRNRSAAYLNEAHAAPTAAPPAAAGGSLTRRR
ncbi:MAG: hypothetical protein EA420_03030 [Candidatus Competibacteraceae bacterium]|jgi:RAQPRD family integrative conjugative element protein|nr:MAG: hypothetical protein EA420_03030 [Candidatus Competibacteraceae bacterium]